MNDFPICPRCGCTVTLLGDPGSDKVCCESVLCFYGVDMLVTVADHIAKSPGVAWEQKTYGGCTT